MIERILTPLDGSITAEAVLPHVRRLAKPTGSEIILVQAVAVAGDDGGESAFRAAAQTGTEYLNGVKERLEASGYRARVVVRAGGAAETVLGLAAEVRASMLAVATHGRTGAQRLVLGSVAETLLRATPVPVFAVRPFWTYDLQPEGGLESQPIRTILVPVGSGGLSLCVLPHAVEMARLFGARVMILHAKSSGDETAVSDVAARFRLEGIEATTLVEPGNPVDTILEACKSRAVDLAVMSTHGRSGLSRLVLGSVTEEVLRHARVPLLVVRGDPSAKPLWRVADTTKVTRK
ncbi:MAG TPA: universal stress protein [Planctomycetota bacterium]